MGNSCQHFISGHKQICQNSSKEQHCKKYCKRCKQNKQMGNMYVCTSKLIVMSDEWFEVKVTPLVLINDLS